MKNYNNDKVEGLAQKATICNGQVVRSMAYTGKHGKGYDGCGTHTHK